jgi:hypothetical protein
MEVSLPGWRTFIWRKNPQKLCPSCNAEPLGRLKAVLQTKLYVRFWHLFETGLSEKWTQF